MLQKMIGHPEKLRVRDKDGNLPLHIECKGACISSLISKCIELYPEALAEAGEDNLLPLHCLLQNRLSSIEDALLMIEKYPAALQCANKYGELPLHVECICRCRSSIISKCIELYPESLAIADDNGCQPLHNLSSNYASTVEDALLMIEKYPAALQRANKYGEHLLHVECICRCRSSIISKCIELYPESLTIADDDGCLPLHYLSSNYASTVEDALLMMEKYPLALEHQSKNKSLPIMVECKMQCRSPIVSKYIDACPESLAKADNMGYLSLHRLLSNTKSIIEDALLMMEKYPAALEHQTWKGELPLHIECKHRCRSSILSKCIELYPEALTIADEGERLPLHRLLYNRLSSVDDALMLIETCPDTLKHMQAGYRTPIHQEFECRHRPSILVKCIDLYPESLDNHEIMLKIIDLVTKSNFYVYYIVLVTIFTHRPMSLYDRQSYRVGDIRADHSCRRRILSLLPRHVFTQIHVADYRDLNWQPRAAMMMLSSQIKIKIQQQRRRQQGASDTVAARLLESLLDVRPQNQW
jgi:hypothetical protein